MARHQPARVEREPNGCGTAFAFLLLLGMLIEFWRVALAVVLVLAIVAAASARSRKRKQAAAAAAARLKPGPQDPWLNAVAVKLAEFGLTQVARNTWDRAGGLPVQGDVTLEADRFSLAITLLTRERDAKDASLAVLALPATQTAVRAGRLAVREVGRVLYIADGRGGVLDEFHLDEMIRVVGTVVLPPVIATGPAPARTKPTAARPPNPVSPDPIRQLGEIHALHTAGALTDAEFTEKKTELLGRI